MEYANVKITGLYAVDGPGDQFTVSYDGIWTTDDTNLSGQGDRSQGRTLAVGEADSKATIEAAVQADYAAHIASAYGGYTTVTITANDVQVL